MTTLDTAYVEGFMAKCAEIDVDPEKLAASCDQTSGETMKDLKGLKPGKKIKVEKITTDDVKAAFAKVAAARKK